MQVPQAKLDSWVRRYGTNSNSYVLLEGPKSYFTSPGVDGFLAYQVSAGVALIAGDPVCAPHQARRLIHDFTSAMMRPVGAYQVSPPMLKHFGRRALATYRSGKKQYSIWTTSHLPVARWNWSGRPRTKRDARGCNK